MATIAERERISRDLHDLLGHSLSLIALKAELAGKLASATSRPARARSATSKPARAGPGRSARAVSGYRDSGLAMRWPARAPAWPRRVELRSRSSLRLAPAPNTCWRWRCAKR
jgi:hypothetical protein